MQKPYTFVRTNIVLTNMTIEDKIKSGAQLSLQKKTILNILYTQNMLSEKFAEVLKPFDVSVEQFNVLRILRGQKGKPANMCLIQERMIAKTSNTTRLVDKLLVKQFVTRDVCADNRRKMEVLITDKGLALLTALDPAIEKHEANLTDRLTEPELQQLNILLDKFRN